MGKTMLQINLEGSGHKAPAGGDLFIMGTSSITFRSFPFTVPVALPGSPEQVTEMANAKRVHMLERALDYIDSKIKKHKPCNDCFRKLPRGKTLQEIWDSNQVWVNYFEARDRYGEARGDFDIAVAEDAFKKGKMMVVATIVHELAHIAGAPGGARLSDDTPNLQAESVLKCCLLSEMFDPNALGVLDDAVYGPDDSGNAVA